MHIVLSSIYHVSAYLGGNEQYAHHLALGLVRAGHQVSYLTAIADNTKSFPYRLVIKPATFVAGKPLLALPWLSTLSGLSADIFHASGSGLPLLSVAAYYRFRHVPTVLTYQGDTNPQTPWFKLGSYIENCGIHHLFDQIITTSPYYEQLLQKRWPNNQIRFVPMMLAEHFSQKLPNKISVRKKLGISSQTKLVLFVGALSSHQYYKGVQVLLQAVQTLPKHYVVHIIGEGDQKAEYQNIAKQMGLEKRVVFPSHISNKDLLSYYLAADIFTLPSTSNSEGFGLVLLEAMACQTPTITTTIIGSAPWFQKEQITQLIPPNNPQALAKAIIKNMNKPDKNRIKRACSFARSLTTQNMVQKTLKLYQDLL
ncbi:glycosyltransferase family 4 protein [Candidatus Beckwithbacteria bacterium]|nr:glycosyltransferase family 4 protein [Candidatus Beckwithbacteria bacterium]